MRIFAWRKGLRGLWRRNHEKFQKNCLSLLKEEDTLVLVGDHSWGRKVAECEQDFQYHLVSGDYLRWVPEKIMD